VYAAVAQGRRGNSDGAAPGCSRTPITDEPGRSGDRKAVVFGPMAVTPARSLQIRSMQPSGTIRS
jgi:hypothetical protein